MSEAIGPLSLSAAENRLAQLIGDDSFLAQAPTAMAAAPAGTSAAPYVAKTGFSGSPFEDILNKTIESLNGVSKSERYTNQLVEKYAQGQAELSDVMIAQAKLSVLTTLAVTTVNTTVNTFKEITQMQV
jgi:flagellar hook-basal body complex protein FliE